jgi:hypothetical protein
LFLFDAGGLFAAASSLDLAGEDLLAVAQRHLETEISKTSSEAVTVADAPVFDPYPTAGSSHVESEFLPVLLSDDGGGRLAATGLALLEMRGEERMPRVELVRALSRCLELTGDSLAVTLEGYPR